MWKGNRGRKKRKKIWKGNRIVGRLIVLDGKKRLMKSEAIWKGRKGRSDW